MSKLARVDKFEFKKFSEKQIKILTWWQKDSPVSDKFFIIADGSIRAGKTISMALSFLLFIMETFNDKDAGLAGKTIGSLRRNLVRPLEQMGASLGYKIEDNRQDNVLTISKGKVHNRVWLFGGKDEASQDIVQGSTFCAVLLDRFCRANKKLLVL